ncbi:MAG: restriction endonuclease subunit S [Clostridiales bacterium]|nr:restriction endonuclease subunit S [Clostridiales bacterium]
MLHLDDKQWQEFCINNIFDEIYIAKSNDLGKLAKGNIPFIGRSNPNNGLQDLVSSEIIVRGHCVSVGMVGTFRAYYQGVDFSCSQNIMVLRNATFSKAVYIFINSILNNGLLTKYSYGKSIKVSTFKKESIRLPINENNEPDYMFIEAFIEEQEERKKQEYIKYAKGIVKKLKYMEIPPLCDKEWRPVYIGGTDGIFSIRSGKRLTKSDMDFGNLPFIGATDSNNGITSWVSTANSTLDSNVLGVNYNGSVVENFYHPYKCIFTDDVKRLHMKNANDNKFVLLFIKVAILKQKTKYSYGYKFNANRMSRQQILLPTNDKGELDYVYMEQYIMNLMLEKYSNYLKYKKVI